MRDKILKLDKKIKSLREARENLISEFQKNCPHPDESVVEGRMEKHVFVDNYPPFRVCKDCGYLEDGWSFWKLRKSGVKIPTTERKEAEKFRLGNWHSSWNQYQMEYPERFTNKGSIEKPNPLYLWDEIK